jgi:rhodanese-related sulfurtransferase
MPRLIRRRELQSLMEEGVQLVEVLPADDYEEEHLPSAINIPLRRIDRDAHERLDRTRAVVVYCWDTT